MHLSEHRNNKPILPLVGVVINLRILGLDLISDQFVQADNLRYFLWNSS